MRHRRLVAGAAILIVSGTGLSLCWPVLSARLARFIETRLAEETGRPWRIGAIGFDFTPALVLRDVVSDDTVRIDLRVATVSGPLSLLAGGTGSVRVAGEGLAMTVPLGSRAPAGSAVPSDRAGAPRIGATRVVLKNVGWAMPDDGRTVSISASAADATFEPGADGRGGPLAITLGIADHDVLVEIDTIASQGAKPFRVAVDPASHSGSGRTVRLDGMLHRDGPAYRIEGLGGTLDGTRLSGSGRLTLQGRPKLDADLRVEELVIAAASGSTAGSSRGRRGAGLTVSVPDDILPTPAWFAHMDLQARLAVSRLSLGSARLDGVAVNATARQGVFDATMNAASVYDGSLKLRYALAPTTAGSQHRLMASLSGNRILPLLGDLIEARGIDGRVTGHFDIQATGSREADLARAAMGTADFSVIDGRFDGPALAQWVAGTAGRTENNAGNWESGTTRFTLLGGSFAIAQGRAVTNDLQLKSPLIQATGTGSVDLSGRSLDLTFQPSVVPQGGRRASPSVRLSVPVRVVGPWENPSVTADMAGLLRDPAGAVEAIQDLGTGLMGPDGGGLSGLLDGIFPKSRPPSLNRR
ncbi:AsmA-like C-terminal region-containing protein [Methylobacterium sp. Leaf93]|uniref:AsmA family protein n=1 Tax=Methylobacterium sp. Leaf93 TaxID=1736249 RepID=UPI0006F48A55|nr:AsmA-like C-terminal region-containing protein [Methylobacterium sp. Leaf93]KQP00973.1 hypothetical protein ASF26_15505 [Methylobacterium sp. Leaf93]